MTKSEAAKIRCERDGAPACAFRDKSLSENPMFGHQHSSSTRRMMSEKKKGRHWYNNGYEEIFCYENERPENFTQGRLLKELKNSILLTKVVKDLYADKI